MLNLLLVASQVADITTDRCRKAFIGSVAIRRDGVLVKSRNGATPDPSGVNPMAHSEARTLRKCGYGATIYVARIRKDLSLGMAKPCKYCMPALRAMGVQMVYWTINNEEWGACIP
jgi:tRNA(Arg) A34 adenosine deaminase TadA